MEEVRITELEEGKYYTLSLDVKERYNSSGVNIIEVKVLIKLGHSIKLHLIAKNSEVWYSTNIRILLFDEIPPKYFRKDKLKNIEKNLEE